MAVTRLPPAAHVSAGLRGLRLYFELVHSKRVNGASTAAFLVYLGRSPDVPPHLARRFRVRNAWMWVADLTREERRHLEVAYRARLNGELPSRLTIADLRRVVTGSRIAPRKVALLERRTSANAGSASKHPEERSGTGHGGNP